MLINLSNHPSDQWGALQKDTAVNSFGEIVDMSFPEIDPEWDKNQILNLAVVYYNKINEAWLKQPSKQIAVHLTGEITFCFCMANLLRSKGIPCVASTTRRNVQIEDGVKKSVFVFVKFREYF